MITSPPPDMAHVSRAFWKAIVSLLVPFPTAPKSRTLNVFGALCADPAARQNAACRMSSFRFTPLLLLLRGSVSFCLRQEMIEALIHLDPARGFIEEIHQSRPILRREGMSVMRVVDPEIIFCSKKLVHRARGQD